MDSSNQSEKKINEKRRNNKRRRLRERTPIIDVNSMNVSRVQSIALSECTILNLGRGMPNLPRIIRNLSKLGVTFPGYDKFVNYPMHRREARALIVEIGNILILHFQKQHEMCLLAAGFKYYKYISDERLFYELRSCIYKYPSSNFVIHCYDGNVNNYNYGTVWCNMAAILKDRFKNLSNDDIYKYFLSYGKFELGENKEEYTCIRALQIVDESILILLCARKFRPDSYVSWLPRDVLYIILNFLRRTTVRLSWCSSHSHMKVDFVP